MKVVDPKSGRTFVAKRRRRFNEPGQPRELTFSCFRRFPFLLRQRTRLWFAEALQAARAKIGFQVWAYVLMPEHVRLLVYPGDAPEQMASFLKLLKERVARQAINYLRTTARPWLARVRVREGKRTGHRFCQPGGGYDRNLTSSAVLRAMIEYLHANPVRRGLVAKPEDWEWSSARWYAGIRPVPMEMDSMVLAELARDGVFGGRDRLEVFGV
jgi:putative transposase